MGRLQIPAELARQARLGETWASWLARLPGVVGDLLDEWALVHEGDVWHGFCSLVLPVRTASGAPAVLKVSYDGDDESEHEALALQHWDGNGTVRMLTADPHRRALLLERLHREDLRSIEDDEACEIVAGLYGRLHVPAPPRLRTVTSYVGRWLDDLARLPRDAPIPRRYVEQALARGRDLVIDPDSTGRMVHGDLHHENVLAADREPWLVIDPKPMSGDPHYELEPMLRNNWDVAVASGDVRGTVRRRFFTLVDVAALDEERARDWALVRFVINANWAIEDAVRAGRPLDASDRDWITLCITCVKAIQD